MSSQSKQAIVTLVVGDRYLSLWRRYAKKSWTSYAEKHALDVIALDRPIDYSPRALARSPAWQKLLLLGQDFAARYERIIWVDSDVIINSAAPLISDGVPPERVGAVDEFLFPSRDEHTIAIRRIGHALRLSPEHVSVTPRSYYESWGLPGGFQSVVQSGVLVLSPKHHREVLEHTYHSYEDRGDAMWHYEMRPLSFELLSHDLVHWIDPRFNAIWALVKAVHYPWLLEDRYSWLRAVRGGRRIAAKLDELRLRNPVTVTLRNSHFLHFASCPGDIRGMPSREFS